MEHVEKYLVKKPHVGPAERMVKDDDLKKLYKITGNFYISLLKNLIRYFLFHDRNICNLWRHLSSQSLSMRQESQHEMAVKNFTALLHLLQYSGLMQDSECSLARDEFVQYLTDPKVSKLEVPARSTEVLTCLETDRIDYFFRNVFQITDSEGNL